MPKLISAETCDAPYKLPQNEIKQFIHSLFAGKYKEIERMINVFDNSSISTRHISVPVEWLSLEHTFKERNEIFKETAVELSEKALNKALSNVNASYGDINNIIFVTSTGLSTPTLRQFCLTGLNLTRTLSGLRYGDSAAPAVLQGQQRQWITAGQTQNITRW
jgi:alkylresorcinol/alkylpyrone synthase